MRKILLILILLAACVLPQQSFAQVVLKTDTIEVSCSSSSVFLVPIRVRDFTDVAGLQFTFQWNPANLDYAYITGINPAFDGIGFDSTSLISQGKLTFSWTSLTSLNLADNEVILNVAFTRIGGTASALNFIEDPTAIFVFDGSFAEVPYALEPGLVKPLDTALPTVTCPANITVQGVGSVPVNGIAPVGTDDCGTPVLGWSSTGATTANFPGDPDASGAIFSTGTSLVEYHATDVVGNTATCSFNVTVEFAVGDDLTFLTSIPTASCGQTIAIDVTAYNFDTIAAFQFSMGWDPAALQYLSVSNLNPMLGITPANFGTDSTGIGQFSVAWDGPFNGISLPDATVLFTLNVTVFGSTAINFGDVPTPQFAFSGVSFPPEEIPMVTVNATIVVTDTEAPTITCPGNVTVQAPGTVAVQNIAPASVADNCAAPTVGWSSVGITVADFPNDPDASGGLFNLGNSTVTYTVTDGGGNSATCSFGVTVEFGAGTTDLTLVANNATAACGGSFFVDVTTLNFEDIVGLQFSLGWDPALIQYTSVSDFNPALGLALPNFGEGFVNMGQLGFGWTSGLLTGTTLTDGDVLFRLNFIMIGSTGSAVTFTDIPAPIGALAGPIFPPVDEPVTTFSGQVTIVDNVPPVITCPANVSVDAPTGSLSTAVGNLQPLTLTDNCGGTPTLSYLQTGATNGTGTGNANGTYNAGTTTVTYLATDGAGNTATCSFFVVVNADTPLILHLDSVQVDCQGADSVKYCITVDNFTDIIGLQFGLAWDTSVLVLAPPVNMVYPGFTLNAGMFFSYSTAPDGLLLFFGSILNWPDIPTGDTLFCLDFNVVNPAGTTTLAFQGPFNGVNTSFEAVPVQTANGLFSAGGDNTPPDVVCPPNDTVDLVGAACDVTYIPPMPTATDACGAVNNITHVPASDIFSAGTTTITYTVSDQAGNTATCSFELTVVDVNAPVTVDCPSSITVNAASDACNALASWTPPTFSDCSVVTVTNNFFPGDLFPVATCAPTTVTYEATDFFGNSSVCTFNVVVLDTTPPAITCPADIVVFPANSCDSIIMYDPPVATDFCDQDLDVASDVDMSTPIPPGTTIVTWVALDDCSNLAECTFAITVVDGAPPTISNCPGNITISSDANNCGANVPWTEPTVSDICDPLVSLTASEQPGSFFNVVDQQVVTYTATDDSGNFTTCTFTVTVEDLTPPTLSNCPPSPIILVLPGTDCDTMLNWNPITAFDNCNQFTLVSNLDPGYNFPTGDTMVIYIATDAVGNADTCSFIVSVRDQVPPVLSNCPSDITVDANGACKVNVDWNNTPTAIDNCSTVTITSPFMSGGEYMTGVTIIQIIAEDASNNYDTCNFTITVLGVPPGFSPSTLEADRDVVACDTLMSWNLPTAVGFCNGATVTSDPPSPTLFGPGVHTITFTATDGTTTVTDTFVITVRDETDPILLCPSSAIEVNVGEIVLTGSDFITGIDTVTGCTAVELSFSLPIATDNCLPPVVAQNSGTLTGGIFGLGMHLLTFIATDAAGNTTTCSVEIIVSPLEALEPVADPNPGCLNETVTLIAPDMLGATYVWTQLPDYLLPTVGNIHTIDSLKSDSTGIYTVYANVNGCITPLDSITVALVTAPNPQNYIFEIEAGSLDTFYVFGGLNNPEEYEICFDTIPDGITLLDENGYFTYQDRSGNNVFFTYRICFCGTPGEFGTISIMVQNSGCSVPNIITPNEDGLNDYLKIACLDGRSYADNSIVIYNQWGDKVFEDKGYTNDPNDANHPAWRGTLNGESGKDLPDGVYFYIFKPGPNEKPLNGFIELFR